MFGLPFSFLAGCLAVLLICIQLDIGHALQSYITIQGGSEAATQAGAAQQQLIVTENQTGSSAPVKFGYYVKQDGSPQQVATDTWNKNVSLWGSGPWDGLTPTWTLSRQDLTNTPTGQLDTLTGSLSTTVSMEMSDSTFGTSSLIPLQSTVSSTVHNKFE